ncbi:hypothetical protein OROGR_024955 [Orobanche gracilis]
MDCSVLVHSVSVDVRRKLKRQCCSPLPDSTRISNRNTNCDFDKNSVIDRARSGLARLSPKLPSEPLGDVLPRTTGSFGTTVGSHYQVFSLLDTRSVCHAAATCSIFQKCAADPMCYSNIDLTTVVPKVNNMVVSTMIQRAGKVMKSLGSSRALVCSMRNWSDTSGVSWNDKRSKQGKESFVLTRSCLPPLIADGGAKGSRLRRLHLYNIETMDNTAFGAAVSACPSLLDLEIVGLGFRKLKYVDFSTSYSITGVFLRSLGGSSGGNLLEILLLQDCMHLREAEVSRLLSAILTGRFSDLRHLVSVGTNPFSPASIFRLLCHDVSNREGLAASDNDWYRRRYILSFMSLGKLLEERPNFCLSCKFSCRRNFLRDPMSSSDVNSDTNSLSLTSSHTSDGYGGPSSSSESSYGSDKSSGNEENPSCSHRIHRGSSDEVAY